MHIKKKNQALPKCYSFYNKKISKLGQKIMANSNIYRTAFTIALINAGISMAAVVVVAIVVGLLGVDRSMLDLLVLICLILSGYISIVRYLPRKMRREFLLIWNPHTKEVAEPGFSFFWGYVWRWLLISTVLTFFVGFLKEKTASVNSSSGVMDLIFWLFCSFLAIVWLLRQQFGDLLVMPSEHSDWNIVDNKKINNGGYMFDKLAAIAGGSLGLLAVGFYILLGIGELYWLWMSFQIGSFWMFVFGFVPPTMFIAMLTGAYGVIFGLPAWVYSFFG